MLRIAARALALGLVLAVATLGQAASPDGEASGNDRFVDEPWWDVSLPGDESLSRGHDLYRYFVAAKAKNLPLVYFRELIAVNAGVSIRRGDWPRYLPGLFGGGTISHPAVGRDPSTWLQMDWITFYNELFHAWWGNVFTRNEKYAADRAALFTAERTAYYRQAHPGKPRLAQEEAYSETIATLILYLYPKFNPDSSRADKLSFFVHGFYLYNQGKTVSPVSHSESPGYTEAAESTFPSEAEYAIIFRQLTGVLPPTEGSSDWGEAW